MSNLLPIIDMSPSGESGETPLLVIYEWHWVHMYHGMKMVIAILGKCYKTALHATNNQIRHNGSYMY